VTWFQVWFWVTIISAGIVWWMIRRAPLMPPDYEECDRLHESTVRVIDE